MKAVIQRKILKIINSILIVLRIYDFTFQTANIEVFKIQNKILKFLISI